MDNTLVLPRIDLTCCTGCGDCVDACHANALTLQADRVCIARAADCDYCTDCEAVCPSSAISCLFEVVVVAPTDQELSQRQDWGS